MNNLDIVRQTVVEKKMLQFLVEGLQNAMAWKVQGDDLSRKLSTLKFICRSFQSHMERLMALEERDGYMDIVVASHPQLTNAVAVLRQEHDDFRANLTRLTARLAEVSARDQAGMNGICEDLSVLLKKVDLHHKKETDLFQEAFEREEGGEG